MLSLPNLREYDDVDLAESLSDSEEVLTAKFEEWTRRRREASERREQEEQECHECEEHERHKREEREAQETREAHERRSREEREQTAHEVVCRGKVSAQCLK